MFLFAFDQNPAGRSYPGDCQKGLCQLVPITTKSMVHGPECTGLLPLNARPCLQECKIRAGLSSASLAQPQSCLPYPGDTPPQSPTSGSCTVAPGQSTVWQLPRKEEALSADRLSVGFPVSELRGFPGMAATPVIPSSGCLVRDK